MAPRPLADLTTLRVGGVPTSLAECSTDHELIAAVSEGGDAALVVGGGSNLVVADGPVRARVVAVRTRGIEVEVDACSGAWVTAKAGEPWDELVAMTVEHEWSGLECLSGIPGLVGATPIQNVGAYGQEVSSTIARVRAFDRSSMRVTTLPTAELGFAYRWSRLKAEPDRFVVLDVTFALKLGSMAEPVRYAELARSLGVEVGQRAPLSEVREQVLALRRGKGMVLDSDDHDTWSVGSFFLNPVLPAGAEVPQGAVTFPAPDGAVKVSAAWLIAAAGVERGFRLPGSRAAVSSKHTLALTNRGGATADEVVALAREVRNRVSDAFGIRLEAEPRLVGVGL